MKETQAVCFVKKNGWFCKLIHLPFLSKNKKVDRKGLCSKTKTQTWIPDASNKTSHIEIEHTLTLIIIINQRQSYRDIPKNIYK